MVNIITADSGKQFEKYMLKTLLFRFFDAKISSRIQSKEVLTYIGKNLAMRMFIVVLYNKRKQ